MQGRSNKVELAARDERRRIAASTEHRLQQLRHSSSVNPRAASQPPLPSSAALQQPGYTGGGVHLLVCEPEEVGRARVAMEASRSSCAQALVGLYRAQQEAYDSSVVAIGAGNYCKEKAREASTAGDRLKGTINQSQELLGDYTGTTCAASVVPTCCAEPVQPTAPDWDPAEHAPTSTCNCWSATVVAIVALLVGVVLGRMSY